MTEILAELHVGDLGDCLNWTGAKICVLENPDTIAGCVHQPILEGLRVDGSPIARKANLEKVAVFFDAFRFNGIRPVLVHCGAGIERSPLTAAYILVTRYGYTWENAYQLLMSKRPQVQDRRHWLEVPP